MQNKTLLQHTAEEALERYVLHQSSESELEAVETHFLACDRCVAQLEQVELRIAATKLALQELHKEKVAKSFAKQQAARSGWLSLRKLSFAGALAMLAITLSVVPAMRRNASPAVNIQLTAYRGLESPVLPKDRNLHVALNANGLSGSFATVALVDSEGSEIWKNVAAIRESVVTVDVPKIHSAGAHLFRLYAPGETVDPMREFSVEVK